MYRQIHGIDPPRICFFCGGPLSDYHAAQLPPFPVRLGRVLKASWRMKLEDVRRRLYV